MERDCYQVEVLHYLNPHLIWVEVVSNSEKSQQDIVFEQIGIYGILPFEITLDDFGVSSKGQRCEDWVGAASTVMKKSFHEAKEVWFRPTYIDRRTSIFDDNIHKYGEIILITHDGKQIEMSKVLINSSFALSDDCLFHQELSLGNLKTKLNYAKTIDVVKHLEKDSRTSRKKDRKSLIKKQTTVLEATSNLDSQLTASNLRKHDSFFSVKKDKMLEKKCRDFNLCKDVDEKSFGRSSRVKGNHNEDSKSEGSSLTAVKVSLLLRKKLELTKNAKTSTNDTLQVLNATKQYLEENSKLISSGISAKNIDSNKESDYNGDTPLKNRDALVYGKYTNENTHFSERNLTKNVKETDFHNQINRSIDLLSSPANNDVMQIRNPNRRPKKKNSQMPEYDMKTEKLVGYGPPGVNVTTLGLKVVQNLPDTKEDDSVSIPNKKYEEPIKHQEMYADIDSDVEIEIANKVTKDKVDSSYVPADDNSCTDSSKASNQILNVTDKVVDDSANNSIKEEEPLTKPIFSNSNLSVLQKKMRLLDRIHRSPVTSNSSSVTTTVKDSSSDTEPVKKSNHPDSDDGETIKELIEKINLEYKPMSIQNELVPKVPKKVSDVKNNVNPFKNIDASLSVFVDKLVTPVLMVHNKMNYPIEPSSNIRDMNFNTHIHVVLKNLGVERPMMLQMISWPVILRGYSLYMIAPLGSGKTFGYLPAVCQLIMDDCKSGFVDSVGPTCIVVCATAQSVTEVERHARMFLGLDEKVVSCYPGVDELTLTTSLLNGCNLFICTPTVLVRLLQLTDFGIDLRRLATFVLEDCERLSEVYASEVKYFLIKIREMLKSRVNKELKVQFVVASRMWCDFMEPLAKKTPNSVICIGAFQECVLYSKANTTVDFLKKESKIGKVLEFLDEVGTKKTVIVCRSNDEVDELSKVLTQNKYTVFACNETMTVEDLYNLAKAWQNYEEPIMAPILLCCDGNLNHLNVSDANYLLHYSMPVLFSMFCKRFSVLNENYGSIFCEKNENVKIKIFLDDSNVEQMPKILNFIKRCTNQVPEFLDAICEKVLQEKDAVKATKFVPICENMLTFGECPDFWNCQERHAIFKEYDQPKDWIPKNGIITFKILHHHTPVQFSARLLTSTSNGTTKKFPQAYSTLSLKMGMYYSKETNKKLHGTPEVGDVCAVSVKQSFYVRCQVLKILTRYTNGTPNCVLIKLIDEEKFEKTRDIHLFHLPEEFKAVETHIVQVRLANVRPKEKDITFSVLAMNMLKKLTADDDLYMRGQVVLSVGNCIMVETLEACQELTSLNETVVMHNLKKELLDTHAIVNEDYISKMRKLCEQIVIENEKIESPPAVISQRNNLKTQWAHLEEDLCEVYFIFAENPGAFFVCLSKFESCMKSLLADIGKYVEGEPQSLGRVTAGDIVLAKFPDDGVYERARVDNIVKDNVVKCFFVDQGVWREVQTKDLLKIPSRFITQMPFQAIECRLIGVQPAGDDWTEFGTNWFCDSCFDSNGDAKLLYVKYFVKEDSEHTGGRKYGVVLIDTNGEKDVVVNQMMIDLNLAQEKSDEIEYLQSLDLNNYKDVDEKVSEVNSIGDELDDLPKVVCSPKNDSLVPISTVKEESKLPPLPKSNLDIFFKQPLRSVPLVDSDNESSDSWDIVNPQDLVVLLKGATSTNAAQSNTEVSKANKNEKESMKEIIGDEKQTQDTENKSLVPFAKSKLHEENNIEEIATLNNKTGVTLLEVKENANDTKSQLDSDDLSSSCSQVSEKPEHLKENEKIHVTITQNSDFQIDLIKTDELRKPKLLWRQNKVSVSIKILLIGSEKYDVKLEGRCLKFNAICNDVKYGFDFDLYGAVDKIEHSDKGQYILVKGNKIFKKNWLSLTKDSRVRKWIVYDVDSIDASSDEEEVAPNTLAEIAKKMHDEDDDSDSDDDFLDDLNYEYKRDI